MDAVHNKAKQNTAHLPLGKPKMMAHTNTKYNRDHLDDMYWMKEGLDMTGSYRCLPDHGMQYDINRMRENGYTLYQDMKRENGEKCRWWFQDLNSWKARIEAIEGIGFTPYDKLKIT